MRKVGIYYIYRGEWIEPNGPGWSLEYELTCGKTSGIPIYKTLFDAINAIRKHLDGTQTAEPCIIATSGFDIEKQEYFIE